jgi:D-sedoheptulose 7-phosphate isomerase
MEEWISKAIVEKKSLLDELKKTGYFEDVVLAGQTMAECLKKGGKIMTAGNGGSAADAQHFTGEIIGRFLKERTALPAITLTVDPTVVTAVANDYGYDKVIARQVEGLGKEGDCVLFISTSGNSENLVEAAKEAKRKGLQVVGLLGNDGGKLKSLCDIPLVVISDVTPRIQEVHTFSVHLLCQIIEETSGK